VVRQLQNFKAGIRGTHPEDINGQTMRPMSMTLADEKAMKDVAAYIIRLRK
jgi:cytochrome c oxidase subunit 2